MTTLTIEQALQLAMSENETTHSEWQTVKPYPYTPRAVLRKVDVTDLYAKRVDKWLKMRMAQ
jgi:hypothetical protein